MLYEFVDDKPYFTDGQRKEIEQLAEISRYIADNFPNALNMSPALTVAHVDFQNDFGRFQRTQNSLDKENLRGSVHALEDMLLDFIYSLPPDAEKDLIDALKGNEVLEKLLSYSRDKMKEIIADEKEAIMMDIPLREARFNR